nr:imidazole glycerol phosphate synthase hisHF, chloroplastic [Tanacetum cinerariifolium]
VQTPDDILNAKRLIFPGVGAFAAMMDVINQNGMADALRTYIEKDRPFLGICLGLQLLFESSEEKGHVKGLGLIPGVVGRFDSSNGCRVPHIGWNALQTKKDSVILDDVANCHVYFVHSYRAVPSKENEEWVSSTCNYGVDFISSIRRGNVHAVQFHPEKSGDVGLSILRKFLLPNSSKTKKPFEGKATKLAKRVIACLDVRTNDNGDLVVTKGDQYDVREQTKENEVRNLGKPVELAGQYYLDGADEVSFLNITGFRDFPLGDLPMLQKAIEYHEWLLQQEAQPRLTRTSIFHDREDAERRLRADYFDDHSVIRQFAYGSTADAFDEYLQMSQYGRGDKKYPTIMFEAVASQDLWIWHAFYGIAGANNDINVLDNSPLFDDLLDDLAPVVPYVVNRVDYRNGYYLADGIYQEWASFVKSFTVATDSKHTYFKQR